MKFDYRLAYTACAMIFGKTLPNKNWDFKPLSVNPIKWSNTLKQFGCCRRIVCMCLTNKFLKVIGKVSIFRSILETQLHFLGIFKFFWRYSNLWTLSEWSTTQNCPTQFVSKIRKNFKTSTIRKNWQSILLYYLLFLLKVSYKKSWFSTIPKFATHILQTSFVKATLWRQIVTKI